MRVFAALCTVVLATGCNAPTDRAGSEPATGNATASAGPQRQIGTISGLRGATSGLTGAVSGFAVEQTATRTVVKLAADTLFAFDKSELTPAAEDNLRRTAELVRAGGNGSVKVSGYTDAKGADSYNAILSQRRALAVVTWLRGQPGLGARQFEAVGRGPAEPVAANTRPDGSDDPEGRARNRRVVVEIPR